MHADSTPGKSGLTAPDATAPQGTISAPDAGFSAPDRTPEIVHHTAPDAGEQTTAILRIGAALYAIHQAGDGFTLEKADGSLREVTIGPGGQAMCSCPAWKFHHSDLNTSGCKHIVSLRAAGLIPVPFTAPQEVNPMPALHAYGLAPICGGSPEEDRRPIAASIIDRSGSSPVMYQIKLTHWDGVPADCGETPAPHEVYPFLDRASAATGWMSQCPDSSNERGRMEAVVKAIRADSTGLKPRCKVVVCRN